tara:strand:+ start:59 stop:2206 length:2148 start_codon:yes stop_codon:yes gene_type:complete
MSSGASGEGLFIGRNRDTEHEVNIPTSILNKHVAMLGSTGSGKTVAAKIIIEEATISGIPSIVIDPQGDLARLCMMGDRKIIAEQGGSSDRARMFEDKVEVRIWTPTKESGLPICLDPFQPPVGDLRPADLQAAWDMMASGFTILAGHDVEKKNSGAQVKAFLYELLTESARCGQLPTDFVQLANLVAEPSLLQAHGTSEERIVEIDSGYIKSVVREELARRFNSLDSGVSQLMFSLGVPMNIETLLQPSVKGKTPINILYLNSLGSDNLRHSFLQEFGRRLYDWMLNQKVDSDETNLVFFIDEVAPYLPPDPRRPPAKDIIKLLFKQGRKYGLSCILATQNVADVDYKILGQANTRFLGRFQDKQDISKIRDLLKVGKGGNEEMVDELPNLKTGEFQLVSPDFSDKPTSVKLRWLYTDHGSALGEDEVEQLTPKSLRSWADNLSKTPIQAKLPPAIPLTRKQRLGGIEEHQQPFESDLMGGLMLLKDSKDPLSVMLGITNLLTSVTLFLSTLMLADAWLDGESSSIIVTLGILICLISCVAVIIETFLADDIVLVKKIRRRSRPLQYFILVWIWFLWFGGRSELFDLGAVGLLVNVTQTVTTMFVILEFAHRLKLAKLSIQLDWNPVELMKESLHSLKMVISNSQLEIMRATSKEIMKSLQSITEIFTIIVLVVLVSGMTETSTDSVLFNEVSLRLLTIYVLQASARAIVARRT